jgi:hypothetical protein
MEIKNSQKKRIYECNNCSVITSNKYDYNKHLLTLKHKNAINIESLEINGNEKLSKKCIYECNYINLT